MVKHVICVKMAHLIYKKKMKKDVQNVSVSVKLLVVKVQIFIELRYDSNGYAMYS